MIIFVQNEGMSIKVTGVSKNYGKQLALDNVSFEINSGEVVGFLGPNGAGKSTMMKIITCFIPQTEGTVKVSDFDVQSDALEVRKRVGYLPEHNPLYLEMYVKEYLQFIAGVHKVPNKSKRVEEMIELVGLELEQHKKIGALSKGYRQRVGLAQAIIHDPEVLILDEPTTGLDPNQLEEIRGLIRKLGREKTVMLSTHIMQEVEAICDRIIIVNQGRIVADGDAETVKGKQKTRTVITVEFGSTIDKSFFKNVKGIEQVQDLGGNSWKLICEQDSDLRDDLFKHAVKNELSILTMNKEEAKLEDVFKSLTK